MEVTQIAVGQWRGKQDKLNFSVLGLGDDSKVYKWSRSGAKWVLYDDSEFKHKQQEEAEGF